jgi:hypothetical protein
MNGHPEQAEWMSPGNSAQQLCHSISGPVAAMVLLQNEVNLYAKHEKI